MVSGLVYGIFNIAEGNDKVEDLQPLWEYGDCGFQEYNRFIEVEWSLSEGVDESGSGRKKPIGLPFVRIPIPVLSYKDYYDIIRTDIMDGDDLDHPVTVHVPIRNSNRWGNCNGVFSLPDDFWSKFNGAEFRDTEFFVYELREITA